MASKLETDAVEPQSGTTLTFGAAGDTVDLSTAAVTLPAASVTAGNLASSLDLSGKTVTLPAASVTAHATTTQWQSVTTGATLTAVAGNGYPIDTTSNACTVTLPASASVGDTIEFVDYAGTWDTNAVALDPQSLNLKGVTTDVYLVAERGGLRIVYVDAIQGWVPVTGINVAPPAVRQASYVAATGPDSAAGTIDGDYKYHVFNATKTGSAGFVVSNAGNSVGSNTVEYLVVAGGGGGGAAYGGGGGAGGYRTATGLSVAASSYNITVGGGGAATNPSVNGSDSVFSSITSLGGGRGGDNGATHAGGSGGSGGGSKTGSAGSGTVGQGYDGSVGDGVCCGAGGGAGAAGGAPVTSTRGGHGGDGTASSITGSAVTRAGGGGGGGGGVIRGDGGAGGGGGRNQYNPTVNSGGGGAGGGDDTNYNPTAGASGVVIIRYKFQ